MVFSQTSHKTQSILKVVDLDRLKSKEQEANSGKNHGVIAGGGTRAKPPSPAPSTSYSEEFLKPEPAFENTMYHETDYGFFHDLEQWYSAPAKEEQVQTIDSQKVTGERAFNNDTLHLPLSPQDWETLDPNSPAQTSMYCITPHDPLSPVVDEFVQLDKLLAHQATGYQEQTLDLNEMPVVFADVEPEKMADVTTLQGVGTIGWDAVTDYNKHYTITQHTMPFIDLEDSLDSKFVSVIPGEVENDLTVNRFILDGDRSQPVNAPATEKKAGLTVNVQARPPAWAGDTISTPDIVTYVEQLEEEKYPLLDPAISNQWPTEEELLPTVVSPPMKTSPLMDYEPITPKSESQAESENDTKSYSSSRKRRHNSEDSDETYTPDVEYTPRSYTRRKQKKPNIPIKDMIMKLEGSQELKKARRGRPPKVRRESTVSVCSVDDTTSNVSAQEVKYRELRDKNNEASKRSRMNRKLKELHQEQLALDLEERNKKLKVKADILEEMTKKLKEALMTAILQK